MLDRIGQAFDVTTLGVHIVGLDHIVVVAVSQSGHNFQVGTQIGSRFPATISATGRCIAAFGDHAEARHHLQCYAPRHRFFMGFGPFMDADLAGGDTHTTFGAKLTLGGWFET